MIIDVKVKTNAREEKVEQRADGTYKAWVKAVPEKGKANKALIRLIADHFSVTTQQVTITGGAHSRKKYITIQH